MLTVIQLEIAQRRHTVAISNVRRTEKVTDGTTGSVDRHIIDSRGITVCRIRESHIISIASDPDDHDA